MSMTVGASNGLSPTLASLLAQLTPGNAAATPTSIPATSSPAAGASNAITGSGKASVSNEILGLFTKMHQAAGSGGGGGAGGAGSTSGTTTTASTASTLANPLNQLMAAIDMDENGGVAQPEDPDGEFAALYGQFTGSSASS